MGYVREEIDILLIHTQLRFFFTHSHFRVQLGRIGLLNQMQYEPDDCDDYDKGSDSGCSGDIPRSVHLYGEAVPRACCPVGWIHELNCQAVASVGDIVHNEVGSRVVSAPFEHTVEFDFAAEVSVVRQFIDPYCQFDAVARPGKCYLSPAVFLIEADHVQQMVFVVGYEHAINLRYCRGGGVDRILVDDVHLPAKICEDLVTL